MLRLVKSENTSPRESSHSGSLLAGNDRISWRMTSTLFFSPRSRSPPAARMLLDLPHWQRAWNIFATRLARAKLCYLGLSSPRSLEWQDERPWERGLLAGAKSPSILPQKWTEMFQQIKQIIVRSPSISPICMQSIYNGHFVFISQPQSLTQARWYTSFLADLL